MAKSHPRHGYGPLLPKVAHLPYGDAGDLEGVFRRKGINPADIAAFVVKPMNATDGFVLPPDSFLADLRTFCRTHGALLVVDEVLTGMGRTGYMFACEHFGVAPDMIILGESLGSGMPLGAVIADARYAAPVASDLATMINGNPVSCAAAQATLDLLGGGYMANARHGGQQLRDELAQMASRHRCLANVRGLGMMSAVDIVKGSGTASPKLRDRILRDTFERGLLLLACGHSGIQFSPPLCLNETQLDVAMHVFEESVQTVT
jgi:4-aminobutyrate aminotransferase